MEHLDPAARLAHWSSRGPRYTSYPSANEFGPIAGDRVRREVGALGADREPVSLYVHVPFCRSLCAYCGCNVIPTRDASRGVGYVDDLATEMALLSGLVATAPITEIALGGGSPNFLAPPAMRTLVGAIERYFRVAPGARRSIELDPRQTTSAQIEALADLRFTAVSLGVQDFAESVQDAIRRHQSAEQTRWLVERSRAAGFDDVNVDIVYGLPRQTEASFAETLDQVIELQPDRVALFGYAHLPSKLPHQLLVERAGRILDNYERASLLLLAIARFAEAGYLHLGLDHFARPGSRLARAAAEQRMVRSFQGYTEHRADAILGLGVSAISSTQRMHWQHHTELADWRAALAAGRLPVERGFVLDEDDRARAALIGRLMCDGTVDLGRIGRECGLDPEVYFARELAALAELGELAAYDRGARAIRTTELGRLLVRNVCMVFDRYHAQRASALHSSTI
ncbi:MAG: oxygen-independent coproporphyrinogen III oxidase [Deltaproteobacteria bacterium]|nr:oxygen-independent coproporphyrinogen III oxidase [Deltaproteobacteria bacterium]